MTNDPTTVTLCVIEGSDDEFVLESGVALDFYPNVGYDQTGTQCWYWITRTTDWVITAISGDTATLGLDPDGQGGPIIINVTLPDCRSRPVTTVSDHTAVWKVIADYVHQIPQPSVDPPVGRGLTGLDTYVAVTPPEPFDTTLISPGSGATLVVHAEVSAVTVQWGDQTDSDSFTAVQYPYLTPHPNGVARHIYEVKTCSEPGARCHPTLDSYPLIVAFEWTARWRPSSTETWYTLSVPDTRATIAYPVGEVISVVTESG